MWILSKAFSILFCYILLSMIHIVLLVCDFLRICDLQLCSFIILLISKWVKLSSLPNVSTLNVLKDILNLASFPKFNGTIYEILAAPISTFEVVLAFVGAGATKTLIVSIIIFFTSLFFVDVQVKYPFLMISLMKHQLD